jgi:iron complex outermembrane receptor protein
MSPPTEAGAPREERRSSSALPAARRRARAAGALIALMTSLGVARLALAQDTSELAHMSLEDLLAMSTTTASGGTSEERATAAGNVTVIRRDEIHDNGWHSIAEALESVPGLYLVDDGSVVSLNVRGITAGLRGGTRLVKIMINGTPVSFRPDLRAFIGPEYIPIEAVERIEIVKGPLSALYGANAFIATINVITREPPLGKSVDAGGVVVNSAGQPGYGGSAVVSYATDSARLLLAASAFHMDRSGLAIQRTFPVQDPSTNRYRAFFDSRSEDDISAPSGVFMQLALPSSRRGNLTLDAGLQQLDAGAEFQLNSILTHRTRESLRNVWATLRHEANWSEHFSTQLRVSAAGGQPTRDDRLFLTDNLTRTFTRNFGYRSVDAEFTVNYSLGSRFSAQLGVDAEWDREEVLYYSATLNGPEGNRPAGERIELIFPNVEKTRLVTDVGAHLQLSGQPLASLPKLQLTANGRIDSASYGDFGPPLQTSARGAAVYKWQPWFITKLIAGRAFQSPTGVLMFAQPGFGVANNVIGNLTSGSSVPRLKPQTLSSIEATVYAMFWRFAVLEVSGFYQKIADKIDFVSAGTDYVARNLGEEAFVGVEGTLQFSFESFRPFANVAWLHATAGQQENEGQLTAYPEARGAIGVDIDFERPDLHLNTRVNVVGPRGATAINAVFNGGHDYSLPGYTTVDFALTTGPLPLLGDEAWTTLALSAHNLFDQRHSEPGFGGYDLPAPGRRALFELRQTF